jgi:hypothetical protein
MLTKMFQPTHEYKTIDQAYSHVMGVIGSLRGDY